jgi:hypothetical protein
MRLREKLTMTVLVAVHLGVALRHGSVHAALTIPLSRGETTFVAVVVFVAPLIAVPLLWSRRERAGVWTFLLSMVGALVFGVHHHYVAISPDNVAHLPPGSAASHSAFGTSAAALAWIELLSAVFGAFCLGSLYPARAGPRCAADDRGDSRASDRPAGESPAGGALATKQGSGTRTT